MEYLIEGLLAPFAYPVDPSKRIFWGFLLSSLILASISVTVSQRSFSPKAQLAALVNPRYWFTRSSLVDVSLLFLNSVIRAVLLVPSFGVKLGATVIVASFLQSNLGDAPTLHTPIALIGLLYSACYFLTEDISRFTLHYLSHKLPWLWHFHKVHHSATMLTPLTIHRVHPVEMVLYYLRGMIVFGLISGLFIYLFRDKINGWDILGIEAFGFLFNLLGANLRHSPIWLSFGKLEAVFISPAQHQIHHSTAPQHVDKNIGTCLAVWDKMMGTWLPARNEQVHYYGLTKHTDENADQAVTPTL
ncbi:hypothetical protein A9Q99_13140 [Gammaproteobacteria bacterium 45_16_T64]|nr:hypothetical protein A9Q99_13140 [Gammaproteobacteria bacterium 45_16_T64]